VELGKPLSFPAFLQALAAKLAYLPDIVGNKHRFTIVNDSGAIRSSPVQIVKIAVCGSFIAIQSGPIVIQKTPSVGKLHKATIPRWSIQRVLFLKGIRRRKKGAAVKFWSVAGQ